MRIKKLKRKSRFLFIKIVAPILILLILSSLLLYKLPTVPFFKKPIISPLAKGEPSQGSNLEALLKIKNIPFTSIRRFSDYYSVMLADGGEVFISSKKDLTIQIDSLQLMLSRLTIEGKRIKSLDFRFDKIIIKF
ncbi:MAG: hypothetical protein A2860_00615 [Candidatus Levybacteria bacterium RIFCSPHIGHO2_01_FULL_37_33]|nr:MAG: hypothetical protein A2860_00615 [Candidatus Levybacteria bacterium RIFCSPHIGHO2_01_FULL_37_33]OGH30078.1 MAG: hypothetical protein A3F30_03840 [Candidatus Levybacteria bacterium RIFCSPHIGHO2_12_FULL_37_12]OGH32476.1 MAG: hypothetical protein A2953_00700 [Candidatus Levybacteria bacterium RIFCSPLOWO2_01_FULL_36_54]